MEHDHALLALGASAVTRDLTRSSGDAWVCVFIGPDTVRLSNGADVDVRCVVETEFDPEEALPPGALNAPGLEDELAAAAIGAVASAVRRAIEPVVGLWPWCAADAEQLSTSGSTWVCPVHVTVAEVGQLPRTEPWTGRKFPPGE